MMNCKRLQYVDLFTIDCLGKEIYHLKNINLGKNTIKSSPKADIILYI